MARIKNKTKIGYWDNDIVEKTTEAVQNMNLTEPVFINKIIHCFTSKSNYNNCLIKYICFHTH